MRKLLWLAVILVAGCGGAGFKITTKSLPDAHVGEAYIVQLKVSGVAEDEEPNLKWSSTGTLPSGLELSDEGYIHGVPSEAGDFSFVVKVENEVTKEQSEREYTLTVLGMEITTPASDTINLVLNITQHVAFSVQYGKEPISWRIAEGDLPEDVRLSSSGLLYGTPTQVGDFPVVVEASDSSGNTAQRAYVIHVTKASSTLTITTTTPPDGRVGEPYETQFDATPSGQHTWLVTDPSDLPPGLELEEDGRLHGTPEAAGTYSFTLEVYDSTGANGRANISIEILPMEIATTQLPDGAVGLGYNASLSTNGGFPAITWQLVGSSQLPPGLQLYDDGTITGVPSTSGLFQFTVEANDSKGNVARATLGIKIETGTASVTITTTNDDINGPTGSRQVGVWFSVTLKATNYSEPANLEWSISSPPEGVDLTPDGILSGVPEEVGDHVFSVSVTDHGTGRSETRYFVLHVANMDDIEAYDENGSLITQPIQLTVDTTTYIKFDVPQGGVRPFTEWEKEGDVPGMDLSDDGYLYGTPTTSGDYILVITVEDSAGNKQARAFKITVN